MNSTSTSSDDSHLSGSSQSPSIIPLGLDEPARRLIYQAIPNAVSIRVAPLDKGLSGASIWLTEWSMHHGVRSAPHVLKIDDYAKLQEEKRRVDEFVSAADPAMGHIALFGPVDSDSAPARGLLRQAYIGNSAAGPISFRNWVDKQIKDLTPLTVSGIEAAQQAVARKVEQLYCDRMKHWRSESLQSSQPGTIREQLSRRLKHLETLRVTIELLGAEGLNQSLEHHELPRYGDVLTMIDPLLSQEDQFSYGLIHGDLHSQNVLVDDRDDLHLIDFAWAGYGWRAVDFLMLECSLKFLVAPNDAGVSDLLELERLIDSETSKDPKFESLDNRICGAELRIIASAVRKIRELALAGSAVHNLDQFRRGLIALSATLGGFPQLHRSFLVHSICYHASRLS
jgi:hypothetical protein